jgi:hypothetical protein
VSADLAEVAHHDAAFESEPGFAVVQIQIQGQFFRLVVDTGSSDLVLFRARVQDRLPALRVTGAMTINHDGWRGRPSGG